MEALGITRRLQRVYVSDCHRSGAARRRGASTLADAAAAASRLASRQARELTSSRAGERGDARGLMQACSQRRVDTRAESRALVVSRAAAGVRHGAPEPAGGVVPLRVALHSPPVAVASLFAATPASSSAPRQVLSNARVGIRNRTCGCGLALVPNSASTPTPRPRLVRLGRGIAAPEHPCPGRRPARRQRRPPPPTNQLPPSAYK